MAKILSKTIALANLKIGCGKLCKYKNVNSQIYDCLALSKHVCERTLFVGILWPTCTDIRRLNSSSAAIKTAVHVEKPDTEHHIFKSIAKSSCAKYKIAIDHENLVSSLTKYSSVAEQVKAMCFELHISDEEKNARLELSKELEKVLAPYFPNCRVVLMGSSINGYGLKGCDIDMSFETGWVPSMQNPKMTGNDLPSVKEVDDGKVPPSKIQLFSPKQQLRFARRILSKYWKGYDGGTINLVTGRCPIIQFPYGPKNVICDLSFGNSAAIASTKLLLFCGKLDERIIPLSKIINYWAKRFELIGSPDKFKSYAFALLLIHFLQTRKPSILPPLKDVFQKAGFFQDNVLFLCDFDFSEDLSKFPKSENKETVEELLKEFFFFYLYFDFTRSICPLNGCTISKSASNEEIELEVPNAELRSSICILDPFSVAWNVSRVVSYKHCKVFIKQLLAMCKICADPTIWSPSTEKWGLAAVIDQRFSIDMLEETLTEFPIAKCVISSCSRKSINSWLIRVSTAALKVLNHALLFKCNVTTQNHIIFRDSDSLSSIDLTALYFNNSSTSQIHDPLDNWKIDDFPEADTLLKVQCIAVNTWQGRCHWNEDHFSSEIAENPLELEHAISLKLLENCCDYDKQQFEFVFKYVESEENGERYLNVVLSPVERCKFPSKGVVFLKKYVPRLVEKICV